MFKVRNCEKFSIKKKVEIFCLYAAMPIKKIYIYKKKKFKKQTKRLLSLKSFSISKSLSIKQT